MTDIMTIQDLLDGKFVCSCGRPHHCDIKKVVMRCGATAEIPALLNGHRHALVVSDGNTRRVCGEAVLQLLKDAQIACDEAFFDTCEVFKPDDPALAFIRSHMHEGIDVIVAVGSGVINDLCKAISFEFKLPMMTVITAPSMDGIATDGSVLIKNGLKVTVPMKTPTWIICDLDILRNAPIDMIRAGIGDVLGKHSALCDWKLAEIMYNEPFCPEICDSVDVETREFVQLIEACLNRDPDAIAALVSSLVRIGILAAFVNSSRPGSGSEHLMAHYLELTGMIDHTPYYSHGVDVGFSTIIVEKLRKRLAQEDPAVFAEPFDLPAWQAGIRRVCGVLADEVLTLQEKSDLIRPGRLERIHKHWPEIRALLANTPDEHEMRRLLDRSGISYDVCLETYTPKKVRDAARFAGDLKTRYTLLSLLRDVNLLDRYAEEMTL